MGSLCLCVVGFICGRLYSFIKRLIGGVSSNTARPARPVADDIRHPELGFATLCEAFLASEAGKSLAQRCEAVRL